MSRWRKPSIKAKRLLLFCAYVLVTAASTGWHYHNMCTAMSPTERNACSVWVAVVWPYSVPAYWSVKYFEKESDT